MNASTSRVSAPLAVCLVGAAIAGLLLLRSPQPTAAPTPPPTTTVVDATPTAESGESAAEPVAARIEIAGFAFGGAQTVAAGQTITVANADGAPHTLTSVDDVFDTGVIDGGAGGEFTAPSEPGTYAYFCALHPSMTGTVTVG